jgi:uncharacterized protein (TIGR02118 family)
MESAMAAAKLVVIYPTPKDVDAFEQAYMPKHIPLAGPVFKAAGATKAVLTKMSGEGAPFHRMAEIHFPSLEALQACAASQAGREVVADANAISNGGPPIIMVAEEQVVTF